MVALNQLNVMDPNTFGDLKRLARMEKNSPEALRAAATQFEAMFLQMVLKAMRDATPPNGLFDSEQSRMFQSMHDQQVAMNMAQGRGIGLADVIFRQLGGEASDKPSSATIGPDGKAYFDLTSVPRRPAIAAVRAQRTEDAAALPAVSAASPAASPAASAASVAASPALLAAPPAASAADAALSPQSQSVAARVRAFVDRVWAHAQEASRSIGVPPQFMVAQAALETGWGRAELRQSDGRPSHNLFNIKAGSNWKGPVVEMPVTEYANGRAYTENARFRAYGSYAEAFRDYANLLRNSPRYADVLNRTDAAGFAQSLQDAGFATDPMYADKITRIIGGRTLQSALPG